MEEYVNQPGIETKHNIRCRLRADGPFAGIQRALKTSQSGYYKIPYHAKPPRREG